MIDPFEMTALLVQEPSEILHYGRLQQATATPDLSLVRSIVLRPPSGRHSVLLNQVLNEC